MGILSVFDCKIASHSMAEEVDVEVAEDLVDLLLEDFLHFFLGLLLVMWEEATIEILSDVNFGDFYCFQVLSLVIPVVLGELSDSLLEPINVCLERW